MVSGTIAGVEAIVGVADRTMKYLKCLCFYLKLFIAVTFNISTFCKKNETHFLPESKLLVFSNTTRWL